MLQTLVSDTLMDAPFSHLSRAADLATMATHRLDLLVIGAGIAGAAIARDAAMRGMRTALIDRGDFAAGTGSRSSGLIHGNLEHVIQGRWRSVFDACRERAILRDIAPHLVVPQKFVFPLHEGGRLSVLKLEAALWIYDLLSLFRNVRRHRRMGKAAVIRAEPGLRQRGLIGGASFFEAWCNDARLTLASIRDAHRHGALVANYAQSERFEMAENRVSGATVLDRTSDRVCTVRAAVVVNATGPWSDELRGTLGTATRALLYNRGVHILVPRHRLGQHGAVAALTPIDDRMLFLVPSGDLTCIGATNTESTEHPDDVRATAEDVVYLLRSANALYPSARLTPEDVQAAWAGLWVRPKPEIANHPGQEYAIVEDAAGLISVIGGTLTLHRRIAAAAVDRVARRLRDRHGGGRAARAPTDRRPLTGGEVRDPNVLIADLIGGGLPGAIAEHLVRAHGSETPAIVRAARADPRLGEPVVAGSPVLWGELLHAMRREMAITLSDLLMRRTRLFFESPGQAVGQAAAVAEFAAAEMDWDAARTASELAAYLQEVQRVNTFRDEVFSGQ